MGCKAGPDFSSKVAKMFGIPQKDVCFCLRRQGQSLSYSQKRLGFRHFYQFFESSARNKACRAGSTDSWWWVRLPFNWRDATNDSGQVKGSDKEKYICGVDSDSLTIWKVSELFEALRCESKPLSPDPNSALAMKLEHLRHPDGIRGCRKLIHSRPHHTNGSFPVIRIISLW